MALGSTPEVTCFEGDRFRVLSDALRTFAEAREETDALVDLIELRVASIFGDGCAVRVTLEDPELPHRSRTRDEHPDLLRVGNLGSSIVSPLHVCNLPLRARGRRLGTIELTRPRDCGPLDDEDQCLVQALADSAAAALGNARATHEHLQAARASEATFRGFFECAPDAMVVVDRAGEIVLVNERTEWMFGHAREHLLGLPAETLMPKLLHDRHPGDGARHFDDLRLRALGPPRELEALRADGGTLPVEVDLAPVETDEGLLLLAAIRDIGSRRRVEEQRFHLAAMVESSDDAIFGITLQGVVTSWNEGARNLFGYDRDEIIGKPMTQLISDDRLAESHRVLERLARGHIERFDTIRRRRDGRDVQVSVTSSPVLDAEGHLVGASMVMRDITDRHRAQTALARARNDAEAANRELEAFSYSVAHDLRAPLRVTNGFARVLLDKYRDQLDAEGQDWLQEIQGNARKMGELIDALLSLARVTRSELRYENVDLSGMVRAIGVRLASADPHREVQLVVADDLLAELDPVLAQALFENLVGNAWKFTGKATNPRIEVGARDIDGVRTFYVRDNGAGFDMEYADKLFGPFQRLHQASEFPGTGIGLATVQRIVNRHGGRIWAEGIVHRGATFFLSFRS